MKPVFSLVTVAVRADGCFSALLDSTGRPFAVTCERTFENNVPVIRNGVYRCVKTKYIKGGYPTFEIIVPGHTRVLFHRGNKETDSLACVLVGENFAMFDGVTGIADSKGGFDEFWNLVKNLDEFDLSVTNR